MPTLSAAAITATRLRVRCALLNVATDISGSSPAESTRAEAPSTMSCGHDRNAWGAFQSKGPFMSSELAFIPAVDLLTAYKQKKLSPVEATKAALAQIVRHNERFN